MTKDPRILFVTSYNAELYTASAKRLLESFRQVKQSGVMLSCYEGPQPESPDPNYAFYNLDQDEFLHKWLQNNRNIIPTHLGGLTTICSCRDAHVRHSRFHKKGCHWTWMNRTASRFFRKVASLRYAATMGHNIVVWLDADTVFKKAIPMPYLLNKLARVGLFCFRGHRPAVESGILGFDLANGGRAFITRLCAQYTTGKFRNYERWDDGFQMGVLLDARVCLFRDLVHPTRYKTGPRKTNNVIPTTDIVQYLVHEKGRHSSGLNLMV